MKEHDIPTALRNLRKARHFLDMVYEHHRDNTDNGDALRLDIIEIHAHISAAEASLGEDVES
jgi:hypothetical protein